MNTLLDYEGNSTSLRYATFGRRFLALVIDGIILGICESIFESVFGSRVLGMGATFIVGMLYSVLLESSDRQATLGKMALGLRVTDTEGRTLSVGVAALRNFVKSLNGLIFFIGCMMAIFSQRKQSLHDVVAGSLVLEYEPQRF
jgi:uncharacterized RDD family membrane protein YckC